MTSTLPIGADQLAQAVNIAEQCQSAFRAFSDLGVLVQCALHAETVLRERTAQRDALDATIAERQTTIAELETTITGLQATLNELTEQVTTTEHVVRRNLLRAAELEESAQQRDAALTADLEQRRAAADREHEQRCAALEAMFQQRYEALSADLADLERRRDAIIAEIHTVAQRLTAVGSWSA